MMTISKRGVEFVAITQGYDAWRDAFDELADPRAALREVNKTRRAAIKVVINGMIYCVPCEDVKQALEDIIVDMEDPSWAR